MRNRKHYIRSILIELVIVFCGVSLAFMLNNYSEGRKLQSQRIKVLASIKKELEFMRVVFPEMHQYQTERSEEFDIAYKNGALLDFYHYRYVQPQYNYAILEYAINSRETEVVDFELHGILLTLYQRLRGLEYSEEKMTHLALEYRPIPKQVDTSTFEYQGLRLDNLHLLDRFLVFSKSRGFMIGDCAKIAERALVKINDNLPKDIRRKIETEFVLDWIGMKKSENGDMVSEVIKLYFPELKEDDIQDILKMHQNNTTNEK